MKKINQVLALTLIAVLVSCGGGAEKKSEQKKSVETTEKVVEEKIEEAAEKEVVEINLVAKGESMNEIAFEPNSLSIPANSRVILTLENKSAAAGMFHNFVLVELGSGAEIATAGIAAGEAKDFVPNDKRVIAYTKISKMGETVTVEFDAPAKGSYHYICSYPGHTSMIGRLNVE